MPDFFIQFGKFCCAFFYLNAIFGMLCYMYPNFMTKVITYISAFSLTILMMIAWFVHFGTIGKYVTWTIDDKEYRIDFPKIGGDYLE